MEETIKISEKREKKIEETPKNIPKTNEKNQLNRRASFKVEGFYSRNIIKERLAKLNSTTKEEKEEKKQFIPKKIDMRRHSEIMRMSLKTTNVQKKDNEIKKFNINEYMEKMKNEEKKKKIKLMFQKKILK